MIKPLIRAAFRVFLPLSDTSRKQSSSTLIPNLIRNISNMSTHGTFTLNNGVKMPALGFGTFASEGNPGETYRAAKCALDTGYRHLDCAWFYQNEGEVGDAIRDFLKEQNGKVKREDLFICTKVWNHLHEPEEVEWSIKDSLKKLQLSYIDLFLIHWPIAAERTEDYMPKLGPDGKYIIKKSLTEDPTPTWRALEKLQDSGLTRSIGVSNFTIPHLQHLLSVARIPPAVNQIEIHPFLPQVDLITFCQTHHILPVAYSPLGSQNQVPSTGEKVSENPVLLSVAKKAGRPLAQILISWGIGRGYPVLPKSSNPERIKSNFEEYVLSEEEKREVDGVARLAQGGRHDRFVNMKDTFGYDVWPEENKA